MTQALTDEFPLNTEQPVKIVWSEANMPDEVTRFTFTYKPDPRVSNIHPRVTIPRYQRKSNEQFEKITTGQQNWFGKGQLINCQITKAFVLSFFSFEPFMRNNICFISSGGILITVTGENVNSVAEPIMVVTVITNNELSVYYQVWY